MNCLGFDIGGTKCAVLLGTDEGKVLFRREIPTRAPEETLGQLFRWAEEFGGNPAVAGVSCGGPLDEDAGVIQSPPNLPGWDAVPVTRLISERFGIPAKLLNDANAGALAEWRFGAGRGTRDMIFMTFGTGLGAGLIVNGRLCRGANGFAGEVGHIRLDREGPVGYGKEGSFEGFASGGGIAQTARAAALAALQSGTAPAYCPDHAALPGVTAKTVAVAAAAGDETARAVYRRVGARLGQGLALLVDTLNPERIVLGGVFLRAERLLREEMERVMASECLPQALSVLSVVPAGLGESIGDLAAISAALEPEREKTHA